MLNVDRSIINFKKLIFKLTQMKDNIFKICSLESWKSAEIKGIFDGYGIDITDGFIHFSKINQIEQTLELHFKNSKNLVLLSVKHEELQITWEKSRNNQTFPHLYGNLDTKHVEEVFYLKQDMSGNFIIPEKILSEL